MSYASVISKGSDQRPGTVQAAASSQPETSSSHKDNAQPGGVDVKRAPSPTHVPKTESEEANVYIVTLLTDRAHHQRTTEMRDKYFPKRLNKLAAHLTLFHALPGSKLESQILPVIQDVASRTERFQLHAARPFTLKKGIAISVPKHQGAQQALDVHRMLQQPWREAGFLSDQDNGGCRIHYTIMNKVDDEAEVQKAFDEVQNEWKGSWGTVEGLGLYRYDRGFWKWVRRFDFRVPAG